MKFAGYIRNALLESFLIYKAERYDVKGNQLRKTLEKYYVVDPGLRRHLLSGRSQDVGHVLENVIFLELLRRGYKVRIGKVGPLEVVFVTVNSNGTEYYQVAATVRDTETLRRKRVLSCAPPLSSMRVLIEPGLFQ